MMNGKKAVPTGAEKTLAAARLHRRTILQSALSGSAALAVGLRAPAVLGQAKQFDGVTLQGASRTTLYSSIGNTVTAECNNR